MKKQIIDGTPVWIGSGNVYADLGYADAEEMLVKARLATRIGALIKSHGWTQQQAAEAIGLPQSKLSKLLNGQFRGISEAKMMECLTRLGQHVRIVVGPAMPARDAGHVEVVFA
jgi:predicted XRE-type DNA-binding protein